MESNSPPKTPEPKQKKRYTPIKIEVKTSDGVVHQFSPRGRGEDEDAAALPYYEDNPNMYYRIANYLIYGRPKETSLSQEPPSIPPTSTENI